MDDERFDTSDHAAAATQPEQQQPDTAELQKQRDEYQDRLLRTIAEFDNYRKRTDRDRQQLADAAAADLLRDLLPIVDDLERALNVEASPDTEGGIRRGVELIHKQLLETLRKRGVTPIESLGTDFDPHFHMAVTYEPAEGRREGEVIEEFTRGYLLGDRLLRPEAVQHMQRAIDALLRRVEAATLQMKLRAVQLDLPRPRRVPRAARQLDGLVIARLRRFPLPEVHVRHPHVVQGP